MPDTWWPSTYLRFQDERTRPARELLAQVPLETAQKIVDVGCGPGNSTTLLIERYPGSEVVGFDSSTAMLDEARKALPGAILVEANAEVSLPAPDTDLVFANATYQWVANHIEVFQRILERLRPGAVLAVQMPDNLREPTHQLMEQVAAEGPWAAQLVGSARVPLQPVRAYYDALRPLASQLDIWHTVHNHVLTSADAVVDWVRGTGLRPFIDPLSPEQRTEFLRRYRGRIADAYPPTASGEVLLRFPRLFIVAVR